METLEVGSVCWFCRKDFLYEEARQKLEAFKAIRPFEYCLWMDGLEAWAYVCTGPPNYPFPLRVDEALERLEEGAL